MLAWAPAPRRRTSWLVPLVVVVCLLAGGAVGTAVLRGRAKPYPENWDPQVADLAFFVETERGLTFEHPVEVRFLRDADFRREVTGGPADRAPADRAPAEEAASEVAILRAMGLVHGDVDLEAMGDELAGDGILGLYDPATRKILVRGTVLDDERRSTLVHELTHALQDQHFDLASREPVDSGARSAFRAVVEADAVLVERAWRDTLTADAKAALEAAEGKSSEAADFAGVPEVFLELVGFPYAYGPDFLEAVVKSRGQGGRDTAITSPPTTEEHILLPERYLRGDNPRAVPTPAVGPGETAIEDTDDSMGMLSLLAVLGERLDFSIAWPAVQGWAGDRSVAFTRDGRTCVRASVVFDDADAAGRFEAAFARWAEGRPATHTRQAQSVLFESCDPGPEGGTPRAEGHVSGIQGIAFRAMRVAELRESGAPADGAVCVADAVLASLGADHMMVLDRQIIEQPAGPALREVERATFDPLKGCRN